MASTVPRGSSILVFLVFLFAVYNLSEGALKSNCPTKEFNDMETILDKLISFGKIQSKFPNSAEEAKKYCGQTRKDMIRLERYLKSCFDKQTKDFLSVLIYSIKSTLKAYCNPKNKRKFDDLLQMSRCVNKGDARKVIKTKMDRYVDTLLRAKHMRPLRNGVGHVCCDYYKTMVSLEQNLSKTCSEKETKIVVELFQNLIQGLIDMGCGDFSEGADTCSKLKILPKKAKDERKYGTFILPLADFLNQAE